MMDTLCWERSGRGKMVISVKCSAALNLDQKIDAVLTNGSVGQQTLSPRFGAAPKAEEFDEPAQSSWQGTL